MVSRPRQSSMFVAWWNVGMRLVTGGPAAPAEAVRMVSEKLALAGPAAAGILVGHSPDKTVKRYRRAVRANRRRLSR